MPKKLFLICGLSFISILAVVTVSFIQISTSHENTQPNSDHLLNLKSEEFIANCFSYQLKGQYEEAIKAASEATKLNPNEPQGYNCICTAYAGVKNYSEAIKASTKYIEIMDDRHELSINAVVRHVDFLVKGGMAIEKAIEFLQQYRGKVSPTKIDRYIEFYRKAQ